MNWSEVPTEEGRSNEERFLEEVNFELSLRQGGKYIDMGVEKEGVMNFWWEAGKDGPNRFGGGNCGSSDLRIN